MKYVAALAFSLALVCAAKAEDAEWTKVIQAAKAEGSVAVYSALSGPPQIARMKMFEKEFGIRVDHVIARASEIVERIRIEQVSKRYLGDIYISGPAALPLRKQAGEIQPMMNIPAAKNIRSDLFRDDNGVLVWYAPYGILISTRLAKPEEFASWKGLLDPKWQGKILADDMRIGGAGATMFEATYKAFGREFHEKLATQKLAITRNNREAERRVATGEYPIYVPQQLPYALALKGLPVKMIIPEEGSSYAIAEFALLTGAPHPNAARLLTQYMLEPDSQLAFANAGLIPVTTGITEKANDEVRPYLTAKLLGTATFENQDKMLATAAEIYK
jgi:ABC-type Fe3+ transport system substrate-binding protein